MAHAIKTYSTPTAQSLGPVSAPPHEGNGRSKRLTTAVASARRKAIRLSGVATVALSLLLLNLPASVAENRINDYSLGVQDKVRIRVFEWRAARDEVHEWAALNSEYGVGPSGRISMPLIGEIAAAGLTPADLAKTIGIRLKMRMGLAEAPDIAVEVTQFRPFYLSGYVEKSGEYPYRPGMTVMQAIALAGGHLRSGEYGSPRIEREMIQTSGDLSLVAHEFNTLLARRARHEAEATAADQVTFPEVLLAAANIDTAIAVLLNQERDIFRARRDSFNNQMETLGQLQTFLDEQIAVMHALLKKHDEQIKLVSDELSDVSKLVAKGISTKPRKVALERQIASLEGDRIRLQSELMRIRQDQSRTSISLNELQNKRATDGITELQVSQVRLETLAQRSATLQNMLSESHASAGILLTATDTTRPRPIYRVTRIKSGAVTEFIAAETATIEPGDTIKVEMPRRATLNLPGLLATAPQIRNPNSIQPATVPLHTGTLRQTNQQPPNQSKVIPKLVPSASR